MSQQNKKFSLSILQWILGLTVGLTLLITCSVSVILYAQGKKSIEYLVGKLVVEFQERILNAAGAYVDSAVKPLRMVQLLGSSDLFNGSDLNQAKDSLKTLLAENPQFAAAQYADGAGNYLRIGATETGSPDVLLWVRGESGVQLYREDSIGVWQEVADKQALRWAQTFEPSKTEWYRSAVDSDSIALTQVYMDAKTGIPVFSCAAKIDSGEAGDLQGVIAINFGIEMLSEFLGNSAYFSEAQAFVLNEERELIAYPIKTGAAKPAFSQKVSDADGGTRYRLLRPKEFSDAYGRELMERVVAQLDQLSTEQDGSKAFDFEVSMKGSNYFISTFNLNDSERNVTPWNWQVFIVIPEAVFLKTIHQNLEVTIKTGGLVLFIGILWSYLLSRRLARPIVETTQEMAKIKEFRLQEVDYRSSHIREVTIMNQAVENMKLGLRSFEKYVPSDLVRKLISLGKEASLGGEMVDLTIFFSDVIDFTHKSESMDPNELVKDLSHYLGVSSDIIEGKGGTIDKFIGDAVMAFWGAPQALTMQPAEAACLSAWEIQKRLKAAVAQGESVFEARMGIHFGQAIVGNIGSSDRMNYTALGDSINLASRLEALNKEYGTLICISKAVYEQAKAVIEVRMLDNVVVKGKTQAIQVYEIIGLKDSLTEVQTKWVNHYEKGYACYQKREWQAAVEHLQVSLALVPGDLASEKLIRRCQALIASPPEEPWEPVHKLSHK